MSSVGVLQVPALYVRWTINTYDRCKKESGNFRFQGLEWCLKYNYSYSGTCDHMLQLYSLSTGCHAPFDVAFHVEDSGTGRILPKLSRHYKKQNSTAYGFWRNFEIEQSNPLFGRTYDLRFLVELKAEDALTENSCRETQTDVSYLPGDPTTTSTSVQTVLNMSNVPCLGNLSEDFYKLLQDQGSEPDVEFRCADHSTKAHRVIVSARSPVIASMLASDMVENQTGVIKIVDMEPRIFEQFLRYLYTGQLDELTFDTAVKLYEAGDQYAVFGLSKKCSKFLMEEISVEKACDVLVVADAHSDADLMDKVVNYMVERRVPLVFDRWSDFCVHHPILANKVFSHGWKMFMK